MPFPSNGQLKTDIREVAISETWASQADWEAYQSKSNVEISNGVLSLSEFSYIAPGSAVHNWQYTEGSGTNAADAIGSADATLSLSSMWSSGNWLGGYSVEGDGTDDYVELGELGSWGSNINDGFAVLLSFESTSFSDESFMGTFNSADNTGLDIRNESSSAGQIEVFLRPSSGTAANFETTGTYDDGNKHRLVVQSPDPQNDSIEVWIDGSQVSTSGATTATGTLSEFDFPLVQNARNNAGSIELHTNDPIDNVVLCSDALTSQEITDDYNAQPWV